MCPYFWWDGHWEGDRATTPKEDQIMGLPGVYSGFRKVKGEVQGVMPGCLRAEGGHVPATESNGGVLETGSEL